jgi:hypothetical protein
VSARQKFVPPAVTALLFMCVNCAITQVDSKTIWSFYSRSDFALTADPDSKEWKNVPGVIADRGPHGEAMPGHKMEIRSRWTGRNLYLLFICSYEQLYSRPNPSITTETNRLWEWDVAETFIGSDFQDIKRYKEFQVSPHGEWVDLDIDRNPTPPNHSVEWNSGFEVKARINEKDKIWYGEMRIPMAKIDKRAPQAGQDLRINFFRFQGPPPDRKRIAWNATNAETFHVPEVFGRLRLQK